MSKNATLRRADSHKEPGPGPGKELHNLVQALLTGQVKLDNDIARLHAETQEKLEQVVSLGQEAQQDVKALLRSHAPRPPGSPTLLSMSEPGRGGKWMDHHRLSLAEAQRQRPSFESDVGIEASSLLVPQHVFAAGRPRASILHQDPLQLPLELPVEPGVRRIHFNDGLRRAGDGDFLSRLNNMSRTTSKASGNGGSFRGRGSAALSLTSSVGFSTLSTKDSPTEDQRPSDEERLPLPEIIVKNSEASSILRRQKTRGLAADWPQCVALREELKRTSAHDAAASIDSVTLRQSARKSGLPWESHWHNKASRWSQFLEVITFETALRPDSRILMAKEVVGFLALLYDLVVTPFLIAWDVEVSGFLLAFAWCTGIYWIVDCSLRFVTGHNHQGVLIVTQPQSAWSYLRRGFSLDVTLLLVDWVNIVLYTTDADGHFRIFHYGKLGRVILATRLRTLPRLLQKLFLYSLPQSLIHQVSVVLNMAKVTFMLLLLNHIMCCIWYMIGRWDGGDTGLSWLDISTDGVMTYGDSSSTFQYITAFHWNIAQVTLGSSDVWPRNTYERLFNVVQLIMGLLIGSTVVSFFSAQIVQFIIEKHDEAMLLDILRRYLAQHSVAENLKERVLSQVEARLEERGDLIEDDVPALGMLSNTLRSELMLAMRMPHLRTHPLFQMWFEMDLAALRRLCDTSVHFFFLSSNDNLFEVGSVGAEAYYLIRGELQYSQWPASSLVSEARQRSISDSSWFCEAALWSTWTHVGDMTSLTVSHLMEVLAGPLFAVLGQHEEVRKMTEHYGRNYHVRIVSAVPPHAAYPDDVCVAFTAASDLISHQIGIGLLRQAQRDKTFQLAPDLMKNLEKEVASGKCALQRCRGGVGLERIVAVAAVKIQSEEGRIFYQIGKWEEGKAPKMSFQLPGTKRASGELPQAALERMLAEDLQVFSGQIDWRNTDHEVETSASEHYMVETTYMRTVHVAELLIPESEMNMRVCWNPAQACHAHQDKLSAGLLPFPVSDMVTREVYFFMSPSLKKATLYAWVHPQEVEHLKQPSAEVQGSLQQWLSLMNLKKHSLPTCMLEL